MKQLNANVGPKMVLEITDTERETAKQVKEEFKAILKKLTSAIRVVTSLRDAIVEEHPSREDLKTKYHGRLLRYRRKILDTFNDLLTDVKTSLEKLSHISDPEMIRLREVIIAEVGELSDGVEAIVDLLKDSNRESFTKTLERITSQIEKRQRSIIDVIDNQLTNHINNDIFGRMKISDLRFRIMRRARLVRLAIREN